MKRKTVIFLIFCLFLSSFLCSYAEESNINASADKLAQSISNTTDDNFLATGKNTSEFKNNFMQSIGILSILIGIMVTSIFFLKRFKSKNGNFAGSLRIESNCYIGNNKKISILEADSQRFLIGITSSQITLLSELPPQGNIKKQIPDNNNQSFKKYFESIVSPSSDKNIITRIITGSVSQNIHLTKTD